MKKLTVEKIDERIKILRDNNRALLEAKYNFRITNPEVNKEMHKNICEEAELLNKRDALLMKM